MNRYQKSAVGWHALLISFLILSTSHSEHVWPELEQVLVWSGDNRNELEAALETMPGRDMEHLIRTARQYDRANLTAEHLIDNITYARIAFTEIPFVRRRYDHAMWQTWVLPYRILDEGLENWRPVLYRTFAPLVQNARSVAEAVQILSDYLHEELEDGDKRLIFAVSENRTQTPLQMLYNRRGGCKEMHLTFIAILRSLGIPARHCTVTWWVNSDWFHYFMQYWDPDKGDWVSYDFSTQTDPVAWQERRGGRNVLKAHAFPAYPPVVDVEGKQLWEHCIDVTHYLLPTGTLEISMPGQRDFLACAYVWNLGAWRVLTYAQSDGHGVARLTLGDSSLSQQVLVTAVAGDNVGWQFTPVTGGRTTTLALRPRQTGKGGWVEVLPRR